MLYDPASLVIEIDFRGFHTNRSGQLRFVPGLIGKITDTAYGEQVTPTANHKAGGLLRSIVLSLKLLPFRF